MSFAITWQIKSVIKSGLNKTSHITKITDLQANLINERQKNQDLKKQVEEYKSYIKAAGESGSNDSYVDILKHRLEQVEIFAGLTELEGPGVIVTLSEDDTEKSGDLDGATSVNIIHGEELSSVVNALFSADAEAISMNGQRLVSTSEIHCAGPTISVNNHRFSQPYEIKAIGDPSNLQSALNMRGGVVELLKLYKIKVEIKKVSKLRIEKYDGAINNKYGQAITGG